MLDKQLDPYNLIKRFSSLNIERVSIAGGEPFLCDNLEEAISLCDQFNMKCMLTTNGDYLIKKEPEWLIRHDIELNISFYGDEKNHDCLMGKGHYKNLLKLCKKLALKNISVGANYMLTEKSVLTLKTFFRDIYTTGADRILIISYIPKNPLCELKPYLLATSEIQAIRSFLDNNKIVFGKGVRLHNYNLTPFLIVCSQNGDIQQYDHKTKEFTCYGNILDEVLNINGEKQISVKNAFEYLFENRLHSNGITLIV